jgi:hypothetical protein
MYNMFSNVYFLSYDCNISTKLFHKIIFSVQTCFLVQGHITYCNVDGQSGVFTVPCRCYTVSMSRQWRHVHRHLAGCCCATLGCDVMQQRCHGDDSTVFYVTVRCWVIRRLFTGRPVQRLYNDSSIQNEFSWKYSYSSTVREFSELS